MVLTSHSIRKSMNGEFATSFDIKVALLGHVSVGKTTVLNALLKDKYSEVSMRRTTAGINHFRVNCAPVSTPAEQILDEITEDNEVLREETAIREKFFNVAMEEELLDMHEGTNLVIVDIPGLNEAGSRDTYSKYVKDSWDTFDCIIVVMDASLGVNSEEQVDLLRFVKENMSKQKLVPLIVLCNKVDDPDDVEVAELVKEVQDKVSKIFPGYSMNPKNKEQQTVDAGIASFIPISAGNAFMYRAASRLPLQEFERLDEGHIDKLGREECGKFKWKRMKREDRYKVVYQVVNDQTQYQERLEACNFDKFLNTLQKLLGGKETQQALISKQVEIMLEKLSCDEGFTVRLSHINERSNVHDRHTADLKNKFWDLFLQAKTAAFQKFQTSP